MNICILDYETSGLNPYYDDIIEIGAKIYQSDNEFNILIKPKSNKAISEKIRTITGITNQMLMTDGLKWNKGYQLFIDWMNDNYREGQENVIVSHNGENFDFLLFRRIMMDMNIKSKNYTFIDTLGLSKRLIPGRYSYSQPALCKTYKINNYAEHRASGDVYALEKLFEILKKLLESKQIDFSNCCNYYHYLI